MLVHEFLVLHEIRCVHLTVERVELLALGFYLLCLDATHSSITIIYSEKPQGVFKDIGQWQGPTDERGRHGKTLQIPLNSISEQHPEQRNPDKRGIAQFHSSQLGEYSRKDAGGGGISDLHTGDDLRADHCLDEP